MPWYAISTLDKRGRFIKRELLFRESRRKVFDFIGGRIDVQRFDPNEVGGFYIEEAEEGETWDDDIDEAREPGVHAVETMLHDSYVDFDGFSTFPK